MGTRRGQYDLFRLRSPSPNALLPAFVAETEWKQCSPVFRAALHIGTVTLCARRQNIMFFYLIKFSFQSWRQKKISSICTAHTKVTACSCNILHTTCVFCVPRLTLIFNAALHLFCWTRTAEDRAYCTATLREIFKKVQRMEMSLCVCAQRWADTF